MLINGEVLIDFIISIMLI